MAYQLPCGHTVDHLQMKVKPVELTYAVSGSKGHYMLAQTGEEAVVTYKFLGESVLDTPNKNVTVLCPECSGKVDVSKIKIVNHCVYCGGTNDLKNVYGDVYVCASCTKRRGY